MNNRQTAIKLKTLADELMKDILALGPWIETPAMETVDSMILRINQIKYLSDGLAAA
jgi:hypothetical protein